MDPEIGKGPQNDQKSLPREGFRKAFPKNLKPLIKHRNTVSQKPETRCENPYETCRIPRLLGPFLGKGTQNDQKALPREGFRNAFSKRRKTL